MLLTELFNVYPPTLPPQATLTDPGLISLQGGSPVIELGTVNIIKDAILGQNPSGALVKQCVFRRLDKICFIYFMIKYANAGTLINSFDVALPAECPVPWTFSSMPNDSWVYPGEGGIYTAYNDLANATNQAGIYKDSAGNFRLRMKAGTLQLSASFGYGTVFYLTGA